MALIPEPSQQVIAVKTIRSGSDSTLKAAMSIIMIVHITAGETRRCRMRLTPCLKVSTKLVDGYFRAQENVHASYNGTLKTAVQIISLRKPCAPKFAVLGIVILCNPRIKSVTSQ